MTSVPYSYTSPVVEVVLLSWTLPSGVYVEGDGGSRLDIADYKPGDHGYSLLMESIMSPSDRSSK